MLRLCMTQIRYVATIATQNGYVVTFRDRRNFMRLFATQRRFVAALRDTNKVCCEYCDSNWVYYDLVRPNHLRDFARTKTDLMQLFAFQKQICCDYCDSKWVFYSNYEANLCILWIVSGFRNRQTTNLTQNPQNCYFSLIFAVVLDSMDK